MVVVVIVCLSVLVLTGTYIIINLVKKLEKSEDVFLAREQETDKFYIELKSRIDYIDSTIRQIDQKGSFEADDEVGFFFTELKKLAELLTEVINPE